MRDDVITPVVPLAPKSMNFYDALREVADGKRIRRLSWEPKDVYGLMMNSALMLYMNNKFVNWIVSDGDMSGTDWVVVTDSN